jgi:hypothetical protein
MNTATTIKGNMVRSVIVEGKDFTYDAFAKTGEMLDNIEGIKAAKITTAITIRMLRLIILSKSIFLKPHYYI